jgi:excisionase family DNA binding protein
VDDDKHNVAIVQDQSVAFLTPKDLQHELQIGEKLCYRLLRSGAVPSVRVGGVYRIPRKHLEEVLLESLDLGIKQRKRSDPWKSADPEE